MTMCTQSPEYAGTKTVTTRTQRDILTARQEINDFIKNEVDSALKKKGEEAQGKAQQRIKWFIIYLITAPIFTYTMEWIITGRLRFWR